MSMSITPTTELKIYVQHGLEVPIELQVDSNNSISNILKKQDNQEQLSIMYKNKLLLNQKETFEFYNIENESTLYVIKKRLNISMINNENVIIQVSSQNTINEILQQNLLLTKVIKNHHHFMFNGILIDKGKTLYELGIHDDVFIYIKDKMVIIHEQQQQLQQQQPLKKKKKNKCTFIQCNDKVCKVIGDCRYCQSSYCSRHRLPEAHKCINLTSCKKMAHERNSIKLLGERCVASKIL